MVLVGLGILFASLTFLYFKVPRSRWYEAICSVVKSPNGDTDALVSTARKGGTRGTGNGLRKQNYSDGESLSPLPDRGSQDARRKAADMPKATVINNGCDNAIRQSTTPAPSQDEGRSTESPKDITQAKQRLPTALQSSLSPVDPEVPKTIPRNNLLTTPSTRIAPPRIAFTNRPSSTLLMPPPPRASALRPLPKTPNSLNPLPSQASTLRLLPSRASNNSALAATSSTLPPASRSSRKVILPPGHSPLDWAHLTLHPPTPTFLRGASVPSHLIRVTPSQLRRQNGRKGRDAWGTWQGKVYNLHPYLDFHPGGKGELMRGAGKIGEAERLFKEIHPWVNWEGMLAECLVGILVGEGEDQESGGMEEMD